MIIPAEAVRVLYLQDRVAQWHRGVTSLLEQAAESMRHGDMRNAGFALAALVPFEAAYPGAPERWHPKPGPGSPGHPKQKRERSNKS